MKCKIFFSSMTDRLEVDINKWLDLNSSKVIVNVQYSTARGDYSTQHSCIIFYKELSELRRDKLNNLGQL